MATDTNGSIEISVAKILRSFRAGDIVFIEPSEDISMEQMERARSQISPIAIEAGISVIILPKGWRVVAREEVESSSSYHKR